MQEIIDTRGQYDKSLPDGEREYRVEEVKKIEKNGNVLYAWQVSFDGSEGERETGEQVFPVFMMGDLLRVLGCEEVNKKFKWDRDLMPGKFFIATVNHAPDKKKPDTMRQNMTGFKKSDKTDEVPF